MRGNGPVIRLGLFRFRYNWDVTGYWLNKTYRTERAWLRASFEKETLTLNFHSQFGRFDVICEKGLKK